MSAPLTSLPATISPRWLERICDLDPEHIAATLRQRGAILFRGFLPDESAFEYTTEYFSERFMLDEGPTRLPVSHRDPPTRRVVSARPEQPFGLHSELATSTASKPHLIWLYCVEPPRSGGATILCDGAALYRALSQGSRDTFSPQARVLHSGRSPVPVLSKAPYASEYAFANALVGRPTYAALSRSATWADGRPLPRPAWQEARDLAAQLTVPIHWQCGDLVMIDNLRWMHGRQPYPAGDPRTLYSRVAWDLRPSFYTPAT